MKQKIYYILNKIFNSIFLCIIIGIILFFKTILFYNSTIARVEKLELSTIFGTVCFIVSFIFIVGALPKKTRFIMMIVVDLIYSVLLFSDNLYYIYSNSFLSVSQIENLQYVNEINASISTLLELKQILYFIDIIVILILLICKLFKFEKEEKFSNLKMKVIVKVLSIVAGVVIMFIFGDNFITKGSEKLYNKDMQIRESTILGYHIFDVKNAVNIKANTKYQTYKTMISDYNNLKEKYSRIIWRNKL